jgi:hypothetical protein
MTLSESFSQVRPFQLLDVCHIYLYALLVGSPSLAAYSLTITVLNGQWITRKFNGIRFGAARDAVRCLRSLQQTPLKISKRNGLLASLVVLPRNDEFWRRLADHLHDQASTWTVPAASSIVWVILAYLLTVIISFMQLTDFAFTVNGCVSFQASLYYY